MANCTDNGAIKLPNYDNNTQFFNDPITPLQFDNQYFKNLKKHLGLFTADESLFNDPRTIKLVEHYANNQDAFFKQFGLSLRKMGKIGVLTGTQGQIRKHCWVRNSHNADPALNPISLNFTDTTANWSHQTPIAAAAKKTKQNKTKLSPVRVHRHFKHGPQKNSHFCTCLCETGFVPIWSFHILLGEIVN